MGRIVQIAVLVLALVLALPALAREAVPTDQDPVAAERAMKLALTLRCLVCQNESIAESHAGLAQDLRRQIREQIAAGRSDAQIVEYMENRYGDFVLYDPPLDARTALLWSGPALMLLAGLVAFARQLRRMARPSPGMSAEDQRRAEAVLARAAQEAR